MSTISSVGFSALGPLFCFYKAAKPVKKAICGDHCPNSFQRLLNSILGEAQTRASKTGRQAIEAVAWGVSGLFFAAISWSSVDFDKVFIPSVSNFFNYPKS